jgi:hydrogenase nickel incorporation protein HypA/HybF
MPRMHEFSIAEALATQVLRYAPSGALVRGAEIRVGAMRGLEPEAMQMSWEAVTHDTPIEGCILAMDQLPWTITCSNCGRTWSSEKPFVECVCGNASPTPTGGDELDLVSITVDEEEST